MHSIAEEMGAALRRTALSPNIKERRDYSCAIFDGRARVIAMGDHMPVHLGSMPMSVQAAIAAVEFAPGDIAILNDPYAGGTHLPDITMVLPVFVAGNATARVLCRQSRASRRRGRQVCRLHGAGARDLSKRAFAFRRCCIVRGGVVDREMLEPDSARTCARREEREGDLDAQIGACRVGEQRMLAAGCQVRHGRS